MIQAFIIVLREGFEAFLIVAITQAYLRRTHQKPLISAVYWGILLSILASAGLGYLLREGAGQSLWEGWMGVFAIVLVGTLVIHMWRHGSKFKSEMEGTLKRATARSSQWAAYLGVLVFTVLMITREGMETVVLLLQVHEPRFTTGVTVGVFAAVAVSLLWVKFSYLVNLRRFFQVTGVFLLLFLLQVALYSVHEFSEAGVLPHSEAIHIATEPFSPVGYYGKWFSLLIVLVTVVWLVSAWLFEKIRLARSPAA